MKKLEKIKDWGRTLTEKQMYKVIEHAETIRRFEELNESKKSLSSITKSLEGKISIPAVYDIADKIGIPEKYIERALNTHYPSTEQQFEVLDRNEERPSRDLVEKIYEESVLETMKNKLPEKKFEFSEGYGGKYQRKLTEVISSIEVSKFLFLEKRKSYKIQKLGRIVQC
jgi:hypothetical protein